MRRMFARSIVLVFCCVGSCPFVAFCAEQGAAVLVLQATAVKGDAYRRVVASVGGLRNPAADLRMLLSREELLPEERLITRILLARITHAKVFDEYQGAIKSFRDQQQSSRSVGARPGWLSGMLYSFAASGPETKRISVRTGTRQIGNITAPKYEEVDRYTDEEVRNGKLRNEAARLAILEHFLKFAEEGGEYEQSEFVDVAMRLWGENSLEKRADDVPVDEFVEAVAHDKSRSLPVRVAAMTRLPAGMRRGERALMLAVLQSSQTNSSTEHYRIVRQAISYFKQHDPETLRNIHAETQWKRVLIKEAAGLPYPSIPSGEGGSGEDDIDRTRRGLKR